MTASCVAITAARLASVASSQSVKKPSGSSATPSRDKSSYTTIFRTALHLRFGLYQQEEHGTSNVTRSRVGSGVILVLVRFELEPDGNLDRPLVAESVERGRIDDPTGEVSAVAREQLDHERVVGDLRMRGDEAERARPLEAEARVVRGDALHHDGRLICFFGAA